MSSKYQIYIENIPKLESVLTGLSPQQLDYRQSEDRWNIREIVAHLADSEIQVYTRYRAILSDDVPFIANHNEANWSRVLNHRIADVTESLGTMKLIRGLNYRLIASLSESELQKEGLHSTRGRISVQDLVESHIRHLENHIGQIERNLLALKC